MRSTILLPLLPVFAAFGLHGQDNTRTHRDLVRRAMVSGGLEIGIPLGEFSDTWGRQTAGFSANMAIPMRFIPLHWGFDFGWGSMGGGSRNVEVRHPALTATRGDLTVRSNLYTYHGLLRFAPIRGNVVPYIDGLLGIRHFVTRTTLRVDGLSAPVDKERRASDFVGSIGWALGLQVSPKGGPFYVEGRVERFNGGRATYVNSRTIRIANNGTVDFETLSSATRIANVHLGVGLRF